MRNRAALPALLLGLALPLQAQTPGPDGEKITNGVLDHLHPSVGLFIADGECSGTLIGCRTVLTAAHCVCGDNLGGPAELRVTLMTADGFHNSNALYIRHGAPATRTA
jgi:hypothetical protein